MTKAIVASAIWTAALTAASYLGGDRFALGMAFGGAFAATLMLLGSLVDRLAARARQHKEGEQ